MKLDARNVSWDDVKLFLACARAPSLRAAATEFNVSSSTIVRRIEKFEASVGATLFDRLPNGVRLSADGRRLIDAAQKLEEGAYELQRSIQTFEPARQGTVRISIMDGLGTFWVMPRLVEFQRANPGLVVDLQCADKSADVLRLEADIAVQYTKPDDADLICTRLGSMHIYPFASRRYLEIYGTPRNPTDIANHRLVEQVAPQIDPDAIPRELGFASVADLVGIRTNSSAANFYAIEKGAGIGGLPTYAKALGAAVEPVDIGVSNTVDIWLTYHPASRKTPRIATVIDWVKGCFDQKAFPWFQDKLIHPNEFAKMEPQRWKNNIGNETLIGRGT